MKNLFSLTHMPVQRKMSVLSSIAMFWYLIIFLIAITTATKMGTIFKDVLGDSVPYDKVVNMVMNDLNIAGTDAVEAGGAKNISDLKAKASAATSKLEEADVFLDTLIAGGVVSNYSANSHHVIETISVSPTKSKTLRYAQPMKTEVRGALESVKEILKEREKEIESKCQQCDGAAEKMEALKKHIANASSLTNKALAASTGLYANKTSAFESLAAYAAVVIAVIITVAIGLLTLFSKLITDSIAKPLGSIVDQIESLTSGEVDLTKKITIASHDEIGRISRAFNSHIDAVYGITSFKKVIEEDQTLDDVYMRIGKTFQDLDLNDFAIYEINPEEHPMKQVYPLVCIGQTLPCSKEAYEDCDQCRAKKTGHTVSSYTYSNICKEFQLGASYEHICYPLTIGGKPGGVVQFLFKKDDPEHQDAGKRERSLHKANQYLKEALSVLEAKRLMTNLRETVMRDPLTGLHNRRFLMEAIGSIAANTIRRERIAGLLMCDIDFFKSVNDYYGHETGDKVLKTIAGVIRNSVRESDMVIRLGGEEFLVVLIDLNPGDAMQVAEKIRENVSATNITVEIEEDTEDMTKTVSVGVCEFPTDTKDFQTAINYADMALLEAKESGRNRVVRFSSDLRPSEINR